MEEQGITLPQKTKVERLFAGKKLSIEAGHVARQANGSVVVRLEDTVVIVNATINERLREGGTPPALQCSKSFETLPSPVTL